VLFALSTTGGKKNSIAYRVRNCYDELVPTRYVYVQHGHKQAAYQWSFSFEARRIVSMITQTRHCKATVLLTSSISAAITVFWLSQPSPQSRTTRGHIIVQHPAPRSNLKEVEVGIFL
jgi:hypothetical protein